MGRGSEVKLGLPPTLGVNTGLSGGCGEGEGG